MAKSRDAFRTISEVADAMALPAHVLRFWESKFSQIRPVKRAGGRRYYRPEDAALLAGIQVLLHERGLTIKGAQRLIREEGVRHVMDIGARKTAPSAPKASPAPAALAPHPVPPEIHLPAAEAAAPSPAAQTDDGQLSLFEEAPVDEAPVDAPPDYPVTPHSDAPRSLLYVARAQPETVRARREKIAPILNRLEEILTQMRA